MIKKLASKNKHKLCRKNSVLFLMDNSAHPRIGSTAKLRGLCKSELIIVFLYFPSILAAIIAL